MPPQGDESGTPNEGEHLHKRRKLISNLNARKLSATAAVAPPPEGIQEDMKPPTVMPSAPAGTILPMSIMK